MTTLVSAMCSTTGCMDLIVRMYNLNLSVTTFDSRELKQSFFVIPQHPQAIPLTSGATELALSIVERLAPKYGAQSIPCQFENSFTRLVASP